MSESVPDPFIGREIQGHRIESLLGRGGMGTVYRTTQISLGRAAALKILPEDLARDRQFVQRFHREAELLSRLSHPNIVTVYDRGEIDGRPFLAMEYVDGPSLRDVLRRGALAPAEALLHVSALLAALQHAHGKGIIHRDIKPENILLQDGRVVKVADFGLSRLLGPAEVTRLTRTQLALGTYEYMSPEQRERAKEADERSDIYAAGVVLYETLTGGLPIGRFSLPSQLRPTECDARIDAVVEKSLEKDPTRRYQEASAMADALSAVLDSPAPRRSPPPHPPLHPSGAGRSAESAARLENHLDNIATVDYVLGTIAYVLGFAVLFGGLRRSISFGFPFYLLFVLGWYLRNAAEDLRRFTPSARTSQAVIALLCAATGVLIPFTLYCFWFLFGHRGRTYYEARGRGLDPREAARYARRLLDDSLPAVPEFRPQAAPAPPAPPTSPSPPMPPTPSRIDLQSVVVSNVESRARRPRRVRVRAVLFAAILFALFVWVLSAA